MSSPSIWGEIDLKLVHQGERLDRVQAKMDLSMTSLRQVQQEQSQVARALKAAAAAPAPTAPPTPPHPQPPLLPSPGAASTASTSSAPPPPSPPPPPPPPPPPHRTQVHTAQFASGGREHGDQIPRRQWSPKMDFPRFDGTDVCV